MSLMLLEMYWLLDQLQSMKQVVVGCDGITVHNRVYGFLVENAVGRITLAEFISGCSWEKFNGGLYHAKA